MFETWQLVAMEEAGYNGIKEEHIKRVAKSLHTTGLARIDWVTFASHCHRCGIDPNNFTSKDLERLQEKINEYF